MRILHESCGFTEILTEIPTIGFNLNMTQHLKHKVKLTYWPIGGSMKIRKLYGSYLREARMLIACIDMQACIEVSTGKLRGLRHISSEAAFNCVRSQQSTYSDSGKYEEIIHWFFSSSE